MMTMGRFQDRIRLIYGFAHFGKSMLWNLSALYFAFYLTEVAGIPTRDMGWVMAFSLTFNALCDLMIGRWLSRFVHDGQAAARLQFKGAILAAAAFVGFAMTGFVADGLRTAFSLLSLLVFRFGYSLMDVPQNSFMAFVASTDKERAALSSTRYIAAGLSVLLITLIVSPLVQMPDRASQAWMFFLLALVVAPVTLGGGWLLHLVFRVPISQPPHVMGASASKPCGNGIKRSAAIYPLLLASILAFSGLASFFSKLESYLTAYVFSSPLTAALFMPVIAVGQIMGQFIWPGIAERMGMPRMMIAACLGWLASTLMLWAAVHGSPVAVIATAFAYAANAGGVQMAIWSLLAQSCAAVPERTALRYGAFTFCSKILQALAILAIGEWLSSFDYRSASGANNPLVVAGMLGPVIAAIMIAIIGWRIWSRLHSGQPSKG